MTLKKLAKYTAVALGGLVISGFAANRHAHHIELYCDRVAALVSSPEAVKSMLLKMDLSSTQATQQKVQALTQEEILNLFAKFSTWRELFESVTTHAHPSHQKRLAQLDEMIAKREQARHAPTSQPHQQHTDTEFPHWGKKQHANHHDGNGHDGNAHDGNGHHHDTGSYDAASSVGSASHLGRVVADALQKIIP